MSDTPRTPSLGATILTAAAAGRVEGAIRKPHPVRRHPSNVTSLLDVYGGYTSLPVTGGGTGKFRTGKVGNRWVLVTPLGNAYWMRGVYNVTGDGHTTEQSTTYDAVFGAKYPSNHWQHAVDRISSWGFNAIGPYSYSGTYPINLSGTKLPWVGSPQQGGITGRADGAGAFKNLYMGLDQTVFPGSNGANFPDVYDADFVADVAGRYAANADLALAVASPYFIGMFSDDTDYVSGFGPGVDFVTDPAGKYHAHLGAIALYTAPTQATNPYASDVPYTDPTCHSKAAVIAFLTTRYGTIGALNTAWGSSYTTWGSDGGWPTGAGLTDENGRAAHTWFGTSPAAPDLGGGSATTRQDLDDFLEALAEEYFTANVDGFRAIAPNNLMLGPTNLGGAGWRAPARGPILRAAGQALDVVTVGADYSQAQTDFIALWAGDRPVSVWEGVTANADSGRFRYSMEAATWVKATQAARGAYYAADVANLLSTVGASTGTHPYIGLLWWEWHDNFGEQANFGLVSLRDNVYDGAEAIIAAGTDVFGFPVGGEEANYGNFLSAARVAHAAVEAALFGP